MEQLLASGKCRAIGVSNYLQRHLREIEHDPELHTLPHLNQCEFSVRTAPRASVTLLLRARARLRARSGST
jgi:diketogulonate reductase-like aldo/keto reductase